MTMAKIISSPTLEMDVNGTFKVRIYAMDIAMPLSSDLVKTVVFPRLESGRYTLDLNRNRIIDTKANYEPNKIKYRFTIEPNFPEVKFNLPE